MSSFNPFNRNEPNKFFGPRLVQQVAKRVSPARSAEWFYRAYVLAYMEAGPQQRYIRSEAITIAALGGREMIFDHYEYRPTRIQLGAAKDLLCQLAPMAMLDYLDQAPPFRTGELLTYDLPDDWRDRDYADNEVNRAFDNTRLLRRMPYGHTLIENRDITSDVRWTTREDDLIGEITPKDQRIADETKALLKRMLCLTAPVALQDCVRPLQQVAAPTARLVAI